MDLSGTLSLFLGLVAGVMFGIVYSKYEDYTTIHDTKVVGNSILNRDNLRGLFEMQNKRGNSVEYSKRGDQSKTHNYAVEGNSFYFRFNKSNSIQMKNPELTEIASWQSFDPLYDADKLKSVMSVFCIVMIGSSSIPNHGKAAHQTWTKHCNDFIMVSDVNMEEFRVKNINLPNIGRSPAKSWDRTKMAFDHAVNAHPTHDWYVKVEHDGFVVVENLRHMLLMHEANIPAFAGHVICGSKPQGSVIALSKKAAAQAVGEFPRCGGLYGGTEDFKELEACLRPAGILSSKDGRDSTGVSRFQMVQAKPNLPLNAHTSVDWSWKYIDDPAKNDQEGCCREYPVTFHYLSPNGLYLMEYMTYRMHPFGIGNYVCSAEQEKEFV